MNLVVVVFLFSQTNIAYQLKNWRPLCDMVAGEQHRRTVKLPEKHPVSRQDSAAPLDEHPRNTAVHPVSAFFASIQLQGYGHLFVVEHGVHTLDALAQRVQSEADLDALGVKPLAHRKAILAAVSKLRKQMVAEAARPTTVLRRRAATTTNSEDAPTFSQALAAFQFAAKGTPAGDAGPSSSHSGNNGPFVRTLAALEVAAFEQLEDGPETTQLAAERPASTAAVIMLSALSEDNNGDDLHAHQNDNAALQRAGCSLPLLQEMVHSAERTYHDRIALLLRQAKAAAEALTAEFSDVARRIDSDRRTALEDVEQLCGLHVETLRREALLKQTELVRGRDATMVASAPEENVEDVVQGILSQMAAVAAECTPSAEQTGTLWPARPPGGLLSGLRLSVTVDAQWTPTGELGAQSALCPVASQPSPPPIHLTPSPVNINGPTSDEGLATQQHSASLAEKHAGSVSATSSLLRETDLRRLQQTPQTRVSGAKSASKLRVEEWFEANPSISTPRRSTCENLSAPSNAGLLPIHACDKTIFEISDDDDVDEENVVLGTQTSCQVDGADSALEHISCSQQVVVPMREVTRNHLIDRIAPPEVIHVESLSSTDDDDEMSSAWRAGHRGTLYTGDNDVDMADQSFFSAEFGSCGEDGTFVDEAEGLQLCENNLTQNLELDCSTLFADDSCATAFSAEGSNTTRSGVGDLRRPPRSPTPALRPAAVALSVGDRSGQGAPTSSLGVAWRNVTRPNVPMFHMQYRREDILCMTVPEAARLCDELGVTYSSHLHAANRKRDRETDNDNSRDGLPPLHVSRGSVASNTETSDFVHPRHALLLLHARSHFMAHAASTFESIEEFTGTPQNRQLRSMPRLRRDEKNALTQGELDAARARIKEYESSEAQKCIAASLAHHALCAYQDAALCPSENRDGSEICLEQIVLREGILIDRVVGIVQRNFSHISKSRVEGMLKAEGVPIDVVRDSPASKKRYQFFANGGANGGRRRNWFRSQQK